MGAVRSFQSFRPLAVGKESALRTSGLFHWGAYERLTNKLDNR